MRKLLFILLVLGAFGAGAYVWWQSQQSELPPGFAVGNGRLEATEIDISTKNPGRLAEILVDEGDWIEAGQVVARMDTRTLEAQRKQAEARVKQARDALVSASAMLAQRKTELDFMQAEFGRSASLLEKGYITRERYDSDQTAKLSAEAALTAAEAKVTEAQSAIEAAIAEVERIDAELDDSVLKTPCTCRVLYRLAEPGEVLSPGGRILVVLDLIDVYMSIYLPTSEATRVSIGDEARIVLDALPDTPIPASVSFVSPQSQFTPKAVETRTEREKLMFRVKVRILSELLERYQQAVKTGVPGVAYVRFDADQPWPESLQAPRDLL